MTALCSAADLGLARPTYTTAATDATDATDATGAAAAPDAAARLPNREVDI